ILWFLLTPRINVTLQNLLIGLTAVCLTVTCTDLLLRPVMGGRLHSTPMNVYTRKLPQLPAVGRWDPNVSLTAASYGDLAAMTGDAALREPRTIQFQTDSAGFRNTSIAQPIEILVLGDSFGAGAGTTQDKVVSRLLETRYGYPTYNLSFPASGPWQQYVNFAIESPRLTFASNAVVVWLLYTGNDLDDDYGDTWRLEELPWKSGFQAWKVAYKTYRGRSPLHQLTDNVLQRFKRPQGLAANVVTENLPDGRPVLFLKNQEEWSERSRDDVERHHNFPKLRRTMDAMKRLIEEKGLKIVIVVLPTKGEVYPWVFHQRNTLMEDPAPSGFSQAVRSACDGFHLSCFDAKPYFLKAAGRLWSSSGALLWWRDDTHLDEHGHEVLAEFIVREVLPVHDFHATPM
ncbi:MAG TPA: hypothetical protein VJ692_13040, partial [Nitrospiraceae bacterium]|nr:hypothetical protein [Nitrospiraceae bacterium]